MKVSRVHLVAVLKTVTSGWILFRNPCRPMEMYYDCSRHLWIWSVCKFIYTFFLSIFWSFLTVRLVLLKHLTTFKRSLKWIGPYNQAYGSWACPHDWSLLMLCWDYLTHRNIQLSHNNIGQGRRRPFTDILWDAASEQWQWGCDKLHKKLLTMLAQFKSRQGGGEW